MKFTCQKCGNVSDISLSLSDCAAAMGKSGIETILKIPVETRKDWQSKGGIARSTKFSKAQLSEWAKRGGRPRKGSKK